MTRRMGEKTFDLRVLIVRILSGCKWKKGMNVIQLLSLIKRLLSHYTTDLGIAGPNQGSGICHVTFPQRGVAL